MSRITNKHVLALAGASAMMLGATAASAQSGGAGIYRNIDPVESSTQIQSRTQARATTPLQARATAPYQARATTPYNEPRDQSWRNQQWRARADAGPFALPGAAIGAAGAVAGGAVAGAAHVAGTALGGPAYGAYAYDNTYGSSDAYAASTLSYRDTRVTPGFNAPSGATQGQHYETPIGDGSLYSAPNGLPMGPQ